MKDVYDKSIIDSLTSWISKHVTQVTKSIPKEAKDRDAYILAQRTGMMSSGQLQYILQLRFDSISPDYETAHDNANAIVDETMEWADKSSEFNIMDITVNGISDDSDNAGLFDSTVSLQIRYMAN